mgnify:CR=1 FL=1
MSYLSCDFSYKISASGAAHSTGKNSNQYNRGPRDNHRGIKGYFQYLAREIDVANGNEIYGYHDSIDSSKTLGNETYFRDIDGKLKRCKSADDLMGAYERRINDVEVKRHLNGKDIILKGQKALKKNSCVLRPIVIQGGEDLKFYNDALKELVKLVGRENIIGLSIHRDETSTHCHVLVVPVSGHSLDQQKVLPNTPKKTEAFHKQMREGMRSRGHDVELENKPKTHKNKKGKTEDISKEQREYFESENRKLDARKQAMDNKELEFDARVKAEATKLAREMFDNIKEQADKYEEVQAQKYNPKRQGYEPWKG